MRSDRTAFRFLPFLLIAALGAATAPAAGAGFELTPTVSYRSSDYECTGSTVLNVVAPPCGIGVRSEAEDGEAFGVVAGFEVAPGWAIEVLANREETELDVRALPGFLFLFPPTNADFTVTHLQVGVARTWGEGTLQPFAGIAAGVTQAEAEHPDQHHVEFDEDAPSASAGGGVKIGFNDRLGLRLEGRVYWVDLPEEVGGDFVETDLGAGLIVRF